MWKTILLIACFAILTGGGYAQTTASMPALSVVDYEQGNVLAESLLKSIRVEMVKVGNQFDVLKGIGDATIEGTPKPDSETKSIAQRMTFQKNVREVHIAPDSRGWVTAQDVQIIVEEGGINLTIYISDRPLLIRATGSFPIATTKDGRIVNLLYVLEQNPGDKKLADEIEKVIALKVKSAQEDAKTQPATTAPGKR